MRDRMMGEARADAAATSGGTDAELRAALLDARTLGPSISRYPLAVPAGADASDVERVLGPALHPLVGPA